MNISTNIWLWIAAFCILAMWSLLYKENPVYWVAQHVFVGSAAGHAIGMAVGNIHRYGLIPLMKNGQFLLLIPITFGILLYSRFVPKLTWLSRWPLSFLVGVGVGQSIYTSLRTQLINQVVGAITKFPGATPAATVNGLISLIGLLAVLTYFLFSVPQTRFVRGFSQLGRWVMMLTFGVSFGNVVSGRISVLLGELMKIFGDWLGMM